MALKIILIAIGRWRMGCRRRARTKALAHGVFSSGHLFRRGGSPLKKDQMEEVRVHSGKELYHSSAWLRSERRGEREDDRGKEEQAEHEGLQVSRGNDWMENALP